MQRARGWFKVWLLAAGIFACRLAVAQSSLEIFHLPEGTRKYVYCSGQLPAAPEVTIVGRNLDQPEDGIKISIANYIAGEDRLVYKGNAKFSAIWNSQYGYLTITGQGSDEEYSAAVRQVYYENLAETPTLGTRSISITLSDADYLPYTEHFYRFIPQPGITWTAARDAAAAMIYNGMKGYLATITSQIENDFIWTKIRGVGWIGASDAEQDDVWKWVTGPEAGKQFWQGKANGSAVNGMYSNWNRGEPNNQNGEYYAHVNNSSVNPRTWNDLPNQGGTATNSQYYPQGYVVEFGGLDNIKPRLSASVEIAVQKVAFSDKRSFDICAGESVRLNGAATDDYSYAWSPATGLSSTTVGSPDASPVSTITYRVTGTYLGACPATADFTVTVHPLPVSLLEDAYPLCEGGSVTLDPGLHDSYQWSDGSSNRLLVLRSPGTYGATIRNARCSLKDEVRVYASPRPAFTLDPADTLICGKKEAILSFTISDGSLVLTSPSLLPVITSPATLSPKVTVPQFGNYPFEVTLTNSDGCVFDTAFPVGFRHQPVALFNIDSTACYGYNLQVEFTGEREEDAWFGWFSSDTLFSSGKNLERDTIQLGTGDHLNRSVFLAINEQGCRDTSLRIPVKVKPDLSFSVENGTGCSPLEVTLSAADNPTVRSWHWDFGDGSSAASKVALHSYSNREEGEKRFHVRVLIRDGKGCENFETRLGAVTVYPTPEASFDARPDVVLMTDPLVRFENQTIRADQYRWDFGDGQSPSAEISPIHRFNGLGFFDVSLAASNSWGCRDTAFRQVAVTFDRLFPPTAFSPNAPDENDRLFRIGAEGVLDEGYELKIWDRWGKEIHTIQAPERGWDGKMKNGQNAPAGVYVWTLRYLDFRREQHHQQGQVTLIY